MGGHAFSELNVVRMTADQFETVKKGVIKFLKSALDSEYVDVLPYYKDKTSFGDIDIIITNEDLKRYKEKNGKDFYSHIGEHLGSPRVADNGAVVSFALPLTKSESGTPLNYVQLDLMAHPEENFKKVIQFFGYNDLCILINRFISIPVFNVRYTMNGCEFNVYKGEKDDHLLGVVSTVGKLEDYIKLMDLDLDKFKSGFNNKEEIYNFVFNSRYFDTLVYNREISVNNISEKERQEREVYRNFAYFVNGKKNKKGEILPDPQRLIYDSFPELKAQSEIFKNEHIFYLNFKKRFNGENISEISGINIKDKKLGMLMKSFLTYRVLKDNKEFIDQVNNMTEEDFKKMILCKKREVFNNESKSVSVKFKN